MSEPQYFIRQGDKIQGPFAIERIRGWITAGRVRPEMEMSEDGTHFVRGDQIVGLFDAATAVPVVKEVATPRPRPERDEPAAPRRVRAVSRPSTPASIIVIGCRILGVIALIVALAMGQWALITVPNDRPEIGGPDSKTTFGLTSMTLFEAHGTTLFDGGTLPYSGVRADAGEASEAASTSKTLGMVIGGLVLVTALLTLGAMGDLFGKPKLSSLAGFGVLAGIAAAVVGWVFTGVGMPAVTAKTIAAASKGHWSGKASGAFSFYLLLLTILILAVAWTRSRVLAMDTARRANLPPPPKRRRRAQSRTGPS